MSHNKELADIFKTMSDCYRYMGINQRFRAIAYENASKTIANMTEPIDKFNHKFAALDRLKGVGKSIAEKIIEYLDTGKIKAFEQLKTTIPMDLLELMKIDGIGPATVRLLHDKLHTESKAELITKINKGQLLNIKGIKERKINLIKNALILNNDKRIRIPYKEAYDIAIEILDQVKKIEGVKFSSLAGSIRRNKETVGDIDIIVATSKLNKKNIIDEFVQLNPVKRVLLKGTTKAGVVLTYKDMQCDIRVVDEDEYGAALLYFTGSKEHNILLRSLAKKKGLKVNEYGVFEMVSGKKIAGKTEESVYKSLGLPYIEPVSRTGKLFE